ncbi:MAG: phytanoyl-CoA dioxygenase [Verrucomicrobiales bacterium]|nr:phytanoyl-CoA dioxygenase [Verrucomicrobiales bacterium]|tara:strand:- start:1462 stop:2394 length:933 start_codon:yes stop_codon:yes gene_type:complete
MVKWIDQIQYSDCFRRKDFAPKPNRETQAAVSKLREAGNLLLEGYLDQKCLDQLQQEFKGSLENLKFDMPCLAQSRIDRVCHKDLIDQNWAVPQEEMVSAGVMFDRPEAHSFNQVLEEFNPSTLTVSMLQHSSAFAKVWLDEFLLSIVTEYMGMVPQMQEAYVRRNYPAKYRVLNHYWHRDLNHPRHLLKMFVFLTDCNEFTGPHEFLRGTHTDYSRLNGERYYSDEVVGQCYPQGSPKRFVSHVSAGTVLIEDTRGVHRAAVPEIGFRDLGYAVFFPQRAACRESRFQICPEVMSQLTPFQKAFLVEKK